MFILLCEYLLNKILNNCKLKKLAMCAEIKICSRCKMKHTLFPLMKWLAKSWDITARLIVRLFSSMLVMWPIPECVVALCKADVVLLSLYASIICECLPVSESKGRRRQPRWLQWSTVSLKTGTIGVKPCRLRPPASPALVSICVWKPTSFSCYVALKVV